MRVLGLALCVAWLGCGTGAPSPQNLLLVTFDTTRADHVAGFGGSPQTTPTIAGLAMRSAVFVEARSESNSTNPSHVSIMSGLPLRAHGVANNYTRLPEAVDTLPEAFARAGFETAGFVAVTHVGERLGWRGFERLASPESRFVAREVTDRAVAWLAQRTPRPFFLWVHYFDPHMTYQASPDTARAFYQGDPRAGDGPPIREWPDYRASVRPDAFNRWLHDVRDPAWPRAMYAAALHEADAALARLLDAVPRDTTAVILAADHGESLGEHGVFYDHVGLYEQQLRIPLLVHLPGAPPTRSALDVTTLDLAPTVVALFGLELGHDLPGRSLLPVVQGGFDAGLAARTRFVHEHAHHSGAALREGDWKLVWQREPTRLLGSGLQLFHLGRDPDEQHDLTTREPERLASMLARLAALAPPPEPGTVRTPDPETRDRLRALGYLEP